MTCVAKKAKNIALSLYPFPQNGNIWRGQGLLSFPNNDLHRNPVWGSGCGRGWGEAVYHTDFSAARLQGCTSCAEQNRHLTLKLLMGNKEETADPLSHNYRFARSPRNSCSLSASEDGPDFSEAAKAADRHHPQDDVSPNEKVSPCCQFLAEEEARVFLMRVGPTARPGGENPLLDYASGQRSLTVRMRLRLLTRLHDCGE